MLLKSIFLLFTVATAGAFSEVETAESPLDQALIAAVDDPTNQEAVLEFLFLQRQAVDQATRFADAVAELIEENPDAGEPVESPLDQALIAAVDDPTNQEAVLEFLFLQRQAIDQATRFAEQWAAVLAKETEESPDAGESVMDSPCHRDSKGDLG